jgi:Ras-related C3 botulinum toxin substrate 1
MVVVGDGAIGKTCLLFAYMENKFPDGYQPTIFENKTIERDFDIHGDGNTSTVSLDLWDTAGQEEFDRLRPLSYRETDVFLVCFSVVSRASLDNIQQKWIPEIDHHCDSAIKVLIGLKCDLRASEPQKSVPEADIQTVKTKINAVAYIETSALKQINISTVFDTSVKKFLNPDTENVTGGGDAGCCVLL